MRYKASTWGNALLLTVLLFVSDQGFAQSGCGITITSLPYTASQANTTYCLAAQPSGSGGITVSGNGVTVDGVAARGNRSITDYASWRSAMKVTSLTISGSNSKVINLDVNGLVEINDANNSSLENSTMRRVRAVGTGPFWFLNNIAHYIQGDARTQFTNGTGCGGNPTRTDFVIWGSVFLHQSSSDIDEPGMFWMHCFAQYLFSNNYWAGLQGTNNKQLVRPRNNSSYAYIENNVWGFVPAWVTATVAASTHTPLYFATNGEGDPSQQGSVIRNNISRNNSDNMYLQGIGGGNLLMNNVFIGTGNWAFSSYSASMGALASYQNNTFASISGNALDSSYASSSTACSASTSKNCQNLAANNAGSGNGGFVSANYANGDFHRNCSNVNEYVGAYPCNRPGQVAPTKPLSVVATVLAANMPKGINLSWQPSSDDRGVVKYIVLRAEDCGVFSEISTGLGPGIIGPAVVDFKAQTNHKYSYRVKALDGDGNESPLSDTVTVNGTCPSGGDTQLPAAPMNLRVM